jgi:hypothetical protein
LQTELAAVAPNRRQPGLTFLQSQIDRFLSTQSVPASNTNKKATQGTGKKGSNRGDTKKRKRADVSEDEAPVTRPRPRKAMVPEEVEEDGPQDEMQCIGAPRVGQSQGERAVGGETNHKSQVENGGDNPVPQSVTKAKTKSWETVDNLRPLTSRGADFLQTIAAISEQGRMDALMSLQDRLSLPSTSDIPQTTSPESIIKRCIVTNAQVMEDQFCNMVAVMQLVIWLEQ